MTRDLDSPVFLIEETITVRIKSNLPVSGEIISQDPSVSNSNWVHVEIYQFFFIYSKYILQTPLK